MPILAALFCFVVAAITTNLPQLYRGVTADGLKTQIEEQWDDTDTEARRAVALTELDVLERAKEQNHKKGEALVLAIRAEIAAVYFLAVAVGTILLD